jgi:hypothetical protein
VLTCGVNSKPLFECSAHSAKDVRPERALNASRGASRTVFHPCASAAARIRPRIRVPSEPRAPVEGRVEGPSPLRKLAPFLCISKLIHSKGLSAPISPLESAVTDSRPIFRISLKTNGCQVLYNQHLRVFSSQVLYIQHLHKDMGGGGWGTFRVIPCADLSPPAAGFPRVPRLRYNRELRVARGRLQGSPPRADRRTGRARGFR